MAIYKNHSRKLEQHTHCHSFFRPFSLLTHCLTRPTLNSIRQTDVDTLMIRTQSRVRARVIYLNQTDIRHQILGDVGVRVTFDNVRHIFKTLNDVTPLWKRSKDANAPDSQWKPSDPRGMTGAFTFYANKSRWILCSSGPTEWKAFDLLYKMRYILWVVALLGACDVTNNGRHLGRLVGFYQGLEIKSNAR